MRGQAEVIATAIMVSIAIVIALGLVYYLQPLSARSSMEYQRASLLSTYAASLITVPLSIENTTNYTITVIEIKNTGLQEFRIYAAVEAFYNNVPVNTTTYTIYNMTSLSAVIGLPSPGWSQLNYTNVSSWNIFLYLGSNYDRLSHYVNGNITVYDLGILKPRSAMIVQVNATITNPIYSYVLSIYARIGNNYYEIARYILYQS